VTALLRHFRCDRCGERWLRLWFMARPADIHLPYPWNVCPPPPAVARAYRVWCGPVRELAA
jgi:hypothetical protein